MRDQGKVGVDRVQVGRDLDGQTTRWRGFCVSCVIMRLQVRSERPQAGG
jgi:hypothetical protein